MMRFVATAVLILALSAPAQAQETRIVRLTLEPAALATPALKYQLLPELRDLRPGNAALLYQRAHSPEWLGHVRRLPDYQHAYDWLELPLGKTPLDKVRAILPMQALQEVDLAARREQCDWEMTDRVRKDGIGMLIPDAQAFREFGTLLALRARLEMSAGRFDKAVFTFQTGLTLGRHNAESPTLINGLVGLSISSVMFDQIEELVQLPGAPNLYWALTDLPRPLIDLRKPLQGEKIMMEGMFPDVRAALTDPHSRPFSGRQLQDRIDQIAGLTDTAKGSFRLGAAIAAAKIYPEAKRYLIRQGRTAAQVDALPVTQVALMYALAQYDKHYDDMYKWQNLPYWQARPGLMEADRELKKSKAELLSSGGIPLAELLVPAVRKVFMARLRVDRRIAALRCVEAIRLYAAGHDGALAAALGDIKEVPIPVDPVTGKGFEYRVAEGQTLLVGPPPAGEPASDSNSFRYEITMRKK